MSSADNSGLRKLGDDWDKLLAGHKITPMLRQYVEVKREHPDSLLFFRLGDFYEMFFHDAEIASRELDLVLTSRSKDSKQPIPMAGVPYHSAKSYIARLVKKGYMVAICEQTEDPATAKGIVRREVVRTITAGTLVEADMLDESVNNYLSVIVFDGMRIAVASLDVSAGHFAITDYEYGDVRSLENELSRLNPSECLYDYAAMKNEPDPSLIKPLSEYSSRLAAEKILPDEGDEARILMDHLGTSTLESFGIAGRAACIRAAALALNYVAEVYGELPNHLKTLRYYEHCDYMVLDAATQTNLEIVAPSTGTDKKLCLAGVLDRSRSAMGRRKIRSWLTRPLIDRKRIIKRQEMVAEFFSSMFLREDMKEQLRLPDLERLVGAVASKTANPRDIHAIRVVLEKIPAIRELTVTPALKELAEELPDVNEPLSKIQAMLSDEPPVNLKDGNVIRSGVSCELDELREAATGGKEWLASLEIKERERTGVKSLKVRYNKVFGYYIEVSKANLSMVPDDYIRKQTLTNAERFYTAELKDREALILGSAERCANLERELFHNLRDSIAEYGGILLKVADILAEFDVLLSFAEVAVESGFVRPEISDGDSVEILEGRHPVVEYVTGRSDFVPNSCSLDCSNARLAIITGPNMAGKSTYIRQVALIVLMAQTGSFVPAAEARVGIVDRIFTRVGASDNLARGQSTFMVEMVETANILNHATARSLIILDEIGRGTSTFDGLSIAWAVAEYIHSENSIGAKALFATHYHELTELADVLEGVVNYSIAVIEKGEDVVFLHRIIAGSADRSYGIEVARLAGLPDAVVKRAREILQGLTASNLADSKSHTPRKTRRRKGDPPGQLDLFAPAPVSAPPQAAAMPPVFEKIRRINPDDITPRQALDLIYEIKRNI